MGEKQNKRKQGGPDGGPAHKKSRGGHLGRWKTPHQLAKIASKSELGTALHLGDQGIWVTYARGMHSKAVREFKELCDEYGESMFGIPKPGDEHDNADSDDDDGGDIEASIQKELDAMKAPREKPTTQLAFTPVSSGIECVFFMKTLAPVDPVRLVRKICEDAEACPDPRMRKCRYINRLTPVVSTERASDNGIDRVARAVLAPVFKLKAEEGAAEQAEQQDESLKTVGEEDGDGDGDGGKAYTYAIRHTIRNHNVFKSDYVIKKIAEMIDPKHKVNLTNPDKVILVEIFQLFCGMSVVDGKPWEDLKRYNVNGLYGMIPRQKSGATAVDKEAAAGSNEGKAGE